MKSIIVLRLFAIFIASAMFSSCSKEKLQPVSSGASEAISLSKKFPIHNYGGISGTLVPVPFYSVLKIYNDEQNTGTYCYPDQNGMFKITDLISGLYRIVVIYIPEKSENGEFLYFEIPRILVEPGVVTELGEIKLTI